MGTSAHELLRGLDHAQEQFVLSLIVRGVANGAGTIESTLTGVSLGPWSIGPEEINTLDYPRASWALEQVATQHLAVALDTALKHIVPGWPAVDDPDRDFILFVRCLRNAFSHGPYRPTWHFTDPRYGRAYSLPDQWVINLAGRHGTAVDPSDYRHAGGLLRLMDWGRGTIRSRLGT